MSRSASELRLYGCNRRLFYIFDRVESSRPKRWDKYTHSRERFRPNAAVDDVRSASSIQNRGGHKPRSRWNDGRSTPRKGPLVAFSLMPRRPPCRPWTTCSVGWTSRSEPDGSRATERTYPRVRLDVLSTPSTIDRYGPFPSARLPSRRLRSGRSVRPRIPRYSERRAGCTYTHYGSTSYSVWYGLTGPLVYH